MNEDKIDYGKGSKPVGHDYYDFRQPTWLALLGSRARHAQTNPQAKILSHFGDLKRPYMTQCSVVVSPMYDEAM